MVRGLVVCPEGVYSKGMRKFILSVLALAAIGAAYDHSQSEVHQASGEAGSGIVTAPWKPKVPEAPEVQAPPVVPSTNPVVPEQLIRVQDDCQAHLDRALQVLPKDYGTEWVFAEDNGRWWGLYFPGHNVVAIASHTPCNLVSHVAMHEWAHQAQDVVGHFHTVERDSIEVVAECFARTISDAQGWVYTSSYPEKFGIPCPDVASEVETLRLAFTR